MGLIDRRDALKGAAATATAIVCEAISKPLAAAIIPRQACGCPRVHEIAYGHTCTVHDERGKRWDAYTIEEITEGPIDVQTAATEWSCYCGKHDDDVMPVGMRCIWRRTSYECDEWECECSESFREAWLSAQSVDWIAMAKEDGLA